MSGVVELISQYSDRVTDSTYRMSNTPSLSDVKVQEYVDTKVDWIKTFVFSGKNLFRFNTTTTIFSAPLQQYPGTAASAWWSAW